MTKRSQNRALYICIILMLITGSIFISVAFGAGKRSSPAEIDESEFISDFESDSEVNDNE